ncbi:MAG: ATP-binding protein [Candidatus Ranarchaeia archaeon]
MIPVEKNLIIDYLSHKISEGTTLIKMKTFEDGQPLSKRRIYKRLRNHVDSFIGGNFEKRVIVMPGLRGIGKTTTVLQIYDYLLKNQNIDQNDVLYVSMDEASEYLGIGIFQLVQIFVENFHYSNLVGLDKNLFLLIDEAHFDEKWDLSSKIVYDQSKRVFIILTGSSALSMEMGVDLARRAIKEQVFPLNFSEANIIQYQKYPPKGTAQSIRDLLFQPSEKTLKDAIRLWNKLKRDMVGLPFGLKKTFEFFIQNGGFPFSHKISPIELMNRLFSLVDRIIQKDVISKGSFNSKSREVMTRLLYYISLQSPNGTSIEKLSNMLRISASQIQKIMNTLEKTHLFVSVRPYAGAGKTIRKPWKYYFLSPSINSAIRSKLGVLTKAREKMGFLAENLVFSTFFRMKETLDKPIGIFYDPNKNPIDFLIQRDMERVIPIEVGIGEKKVGSLRKAIQYYKSPYGILISSQNTISFENNIVKIPIEFFSFI